MNYDEPRQRQDNHLWHYTRKNDNQIWPIGYCADSCPGHSTPEEARDHYRSYMFDNHLSLDHTMSNQQRHCEAPDCNEWTQKFAMLGQWQMFILCDAHRNRATIELLVPDIGDSIHS